MRSMIASASTNRPPRFDGRDLPAKLDQPFAEPTTTTTSQIADSSTPRPDIACGLFGGIALHLGF